MTPAVSGFRATVEYYAKAIVGSLVAGATAFQVANADGVVNTNEKVGVAIAFLTTLATIWGVTNGPEPVDFGEV